MGSDAVSSFVNLFLSLQRLNEQITKQSPSLGRDAVYSKSVRISSVSVIIRVSIFMARSLLLLLVQDQQVASLPLGEVYALLL